VWGSEKTRFILMIYKITRPKQTSNYTYLNPNTKLDPPLCIFQPPRPNWTHVIHNYELSRPKTTHIMHSIIAKIKTNPTLCIFEPQSQNKHPLYMHLWGPKTKANSYYSHLWGSKTKIHLHHVFFNPQNKLSIMYVQTSKAKTNPHYSNL
jgi:hypothetical protein